MTDNDKCCICGKVLFIDGKRQKELARVWAVCEKMKATVKKEE